MIGEDRLLRISGLKSEMAKQLILDYANHGTVCEACGRIIVSTYYHDKYLIRNLGGEIVLSPVIHHHTSYKSDDIMLVCNVCHAKIHFRKECKYKPADSRPNPNPKYKIVPCRRCGGGARIAFDEPNGKALCYYCKKAAGHSDNKGKVPSRAHRYMDEVDFCNAGFKDDLSDFYKRM